MEKKDKRRVKVYTLGEDSNWVDKGTGHVDCTFIERKNGLCIVVRSEKDEETILLESKVSTDEIYQLQQDTLIVWNDPETDLDLALSFQEKEGCKEVWDQLASVRKLQHNEESQENDSQANGDESPSPLPPANLSNLEKILETVTSASTQHYKKEKFIIQAVKENYLQKLLMVFTVCEDVEDERSLHLLFQIFTGIILMNDTAIFEILFTDECIMLLMGVLEYDPELPTKQRHREYLKSQALFKKVVDLSNSQIESKIHQTFRIQYLKDVVLARLLDDPTFATLNSLIYFNNVEILGGIMRDDKLLQELFSKLKDEKATIAEKKDAFLFLQEICNMIRSVQQNTKATFYGTLVGHDLLGVVKDNLLSPDTKIKITIVNILESVITYDSAAVRKYILKDKPFLKVLIDAFLGDLDSGIRIQLTEILRTLIDTSTMQISPEHDDFLSLFYTDPIKRLVETLEKPDEELPENVKETVCDILSFCVSHHGYRIKYFILGNNVTFKVAALLKSKHKPLVLAAIRFFRVFVGMKDDFYNRHMIQKNLFEPIMNLFMENVDKYNLINSAIIELFDFIRKENQKTLIQYIVEKYGQSLKNVNYVDTFKVLLIKYDQNQDQNKEVEAPAQPQQPASIRKSGEEDEDYFSTEDEEEHSSGPTTAKEPDHEFKPLTLKKDEEDPSFNILPKPHKDDNGLKKAKISINLGLSTVSRELQDSHEDEPVKKKQKSDTS